jgi:hypothetical protein
LRADRERKLSNVIAIWGLDNKQEIIVARSQIDILDFNSEFLGELFGCFVPFGRILDLVDPLLGPIE